MTPKIHPSAEVFGNLKATYKVKRLESSKPMKIRYLLLGKSALTFSVCDKYRRFNKYDFFNIKNIFKFQKKYCAVEVFPNIG